MSLSLSFLQDERTDPSKRHTATAAMRGLVEERVRRLTGSAPDLQFDMDVVSCFGSYRTFAAFRACARHIEDYGSLEGYDPEAETSAPVGERARFRSESKRFRHLCEHSDHDGWYFPADFDIPLRVEDAEAGYTVTGLLSVGSSVGLLRELHDMNRHL